MQNPQRHQTPARERRDDQGDHHGSQHSAHGGLLFHSGAFTVGRLRSRY